MGEIAGILLGLAVLAAVAGLHLGYHAHLAATVLGAVAAVCLVIIAAGGGHPAWLWGVLAGDVAFTALVGVWGWRGVAAGRAALPERHLLTGSGATGVAVSDLDPDGIVTVNGERWSAVAVNAPVHKGCAVQVVGRGGVKLQVWGLDLGAPIGEER